MSGTRANGDGDNDQGVGWDGIDVGYVVGSGNFSGISPKEVPNCGCRIVGWVGSEGEVGGARGRGRRIGIANITKGVGVILLAIKLLVVDVSLLSLSALKLKKHRHEH
ncbi:hypothetical protein LguiA_006992 [Lonicera macranthoides]